MIRYIFAALFSLLCIYVWKDRKNFERDGFLFVRRSKVGLKVFDQLAKLPFLRIIYTLAVPFCTLLMVLIFLMFLSNAVYVLLTPTAQAGVAPIIPGVRVPGSPIYIPFGYGVFALLVLMLVHESSHAIAARVEKIKVRSVGAILMLVIPGAFAEMDEKQFEKAPKISRLRIAAAGSFANILTALLALMLIVSMLGGADARGVVLTEVLQDTPAEEAFTRTTVITAVDGTEVDSLEDLYLIINATVPNQLLTFDTVKYEDGVLTEEQIELTTTQHPNGTSGFVGIPANSVVKLDPRMIYFTLPLQPIAIIKLVSPEFWEVEQWTLLFALKWIAFLNFAIGLVNLLPFFSLDGGVMLRDFVSYVSPKKAEKVVRWVGKFIILLLLANLVPYFR